MLIGVMFEADDVGLGESEDSLLAEHAVNKLVSISAAMIDLHLILVECDMFDNLDVLMLSTSFANSHRSPPSRMVTLKYIIFISLN